LSDNRYSIVINHTRNLSYVQPYVYHLPEMGKITLEG
jgi:hypothetical protein